MRVDSAPAHAAGASAQPSLGALAWIFLRIACVSFGGFMWPGVYGTLLLIGGAGLAGWLCFGRVPKVDGGAIVAGAPLPGWPAGLFAAAAMLALLLTPALLRMLLLAFSGISLVMFGGGYVVIPALLFLLACVALLRFRIDPVWIVPAAGLLGLGRY